MSPRSRQSTLVPIAYGLLLGLMIIAIFVLSENNLSPPRADITDAPFIEHTGDVDPVVATNQTLSMLFAGFDPDTPPVGRNILSLPLTPSGLPYNAEFQRLPYNIGTAQGEIYVLQWTPEEGQAGAHQLSFDIQDGSPLPLTVTVDQEDTLPNALTDNTLILYNENATDAMEIAAYYAAVRGMEPDHLCPIKMPTGNYASKDELLGARKTIVEQCICPLVPVDQRPTPCDISNVNALSQVSPISHMAIVRGIPHRLTQTGWGSDNQDPALDVYLSHLLYKPTSSIFGAGTSGNEPLPKLTFMNPGNLTAGLDPARDKMVAYGRIEAMTKERTFDLIDRTLEAEALGVTGNFLWGGGIVEFPTDIVGHILMDLSGSRAQTCRDHVINGTAWPYQTCRAGITIDGSIPGVIGSTIPLAVNTGIFVNTNASVTNQSGFNGDFDRMLNWHKSDETCTELCRDLPTEQQREACRENSTDYFREINTECVGVARGFIGFQLRSFNVGLYGLFPQGWNPRDAGATEREAPVKITGGGFQNDRFTDDTFLRFGGSANSPDPRCRLESGTEISCKERVPIMMQYIHGFSPQIEFPLPSDEFRFRVKMRYRTSPNGNSNGQLRLIARPLDENLAAPVVGGNAYTPSNIAILNDTSGEWQTLEVAGAVNAESLVGNRLARLNIEIRSFFTDDIRDYIDIDGIELLNDETGEQLMNADIGSFSAPDIYNLAEGDFPANVIDRLGGIGWWGSASHHLTGGFAFANVDETLRSLFSGLSLGESVYVSDNPMSGTIYADPLYSPAAIQLFIGNGSQPTYIPSGSTNPNTYRVFTVTGNGETLLTSAPLRYRVLHGREHFGETQWQVDVCLNNTIPHNCDATNAWTMVHEGKGGVQNGTLPFTVLDLLENPLVSQSVFLRLKAWNPGEESDALISYAYLYYQYQP